MYPPRLRSIIKSYWFRRKHTHRQPLLCYVIIYLFSSLSQLFYRSIHEHFACNNKANIMLFRYINSIYLFLISFSG